MRPVTSKTPNTTPALPLALQALVRRCTAQNDNIAAIEARLAKAYEFATELLLQGHKGDRRLWEHADDLELSDGTTQWADVEAEIAKALTAADPHTDAAYMIGHIRWPAQEAGFLLGLAVAFEISRSFAGGAR